MNDTYEINANARKSIKNAKEYIEKIKNNSSSHQMKISAIHYMGLRAKSEGKKKIYQILREGKQKLRKEYILNLIKKNEAILNEEL
tara:strand:- start:1004 stop:1261 length:258 start_codon:yes stop_codon:yes gene_type:complete